MCSLAQGACGVVLQGALLTLDTATPVWLSDTRGQGQLVRGTRSSRRPPPACAISVPLRVVNSSHSRPLADCSRPRSSPFSWKIWPICKQDVRSLLRFGSTSQKASQLIMGGIVPYTLPACG
jgi:hypothetical protein